MLARVHIAWLGVLLAVTQTMSLRRPFKPQVILLGPGIRRSSCGYYGNTDISAWVVEILLQSESADRSVCAGTLLAPNVVLTAAYCVKHKDEKLDVRAYGERHTIRETVFSTEWDKVLKVALLILDSPVRLHANMLPLCLPDANATLDLSQCASAFYDENREKVEVDIKIVDKERCQDLMLVSINSTEIALCGIGKALKPGSGGAPLFCEIPGLEDRYQLAGVLSSGRYFNDTQPEHQSFTDIQKLRSWIDSELKRRGIERKYYSVNGMF